MVEVKEFNVQTDIEDPGSEENTGFLPDDGLPELSVGCNYYVQLNHCSRDPRRARRCIGNYRGLNDQGKLVFETPPVGSLQFNPGAFVEGLEVGIFEIAPTGKTARKLSKGRSGDGNGNGNGYRK